MRIPRAQLEATVRRLEGESTTSAIALNAVLNNTVQWFRKAPYHIGIAQPCGGHGGVVIVRFLPAGQAPSAAAYYWESWWPGVRDHMPAPSNMEAHTLRVLAIQAHEYILKCQRPQP